MLLTIQCVTENGGTNNTESCLNSKIRTVEIRPGVCCKYFKKFNLNCAQPSAKWTLTSASVQLDLNSHTYSERANIIKIKRRWFVWAQVLYLTLCLANIWLSIITTSIYRKSKRILIIYHRINKQNACEFHSVVLLFTSDRLHFWLHSTHVLQIATPWKFNQGIFFPIINVNTICGMHLKTQFSVNYSSFHKHALQVSCRNTSWKLQFFIESD